MGYNAASACCSCGGGKSIVAAGAHEEEEEEDGGNEDYNGVGHVSCGCPSCTSDILETVVDNETIGQRIKWIVDNLNESEVDACELVCGEELDDICGDACNPSTCNS